MVGVSMNDVTKRVLFSMCMGKGDVLLVDVLNYLHRFAWVFRDMTTNIGGTPQSVGHIYGFLRFLCYLKDKFPQCSIVLALDGIDTERREINANYKTNRECSYKLDISLEEILDMCSLIDGVYTCFDSTKEADDVIGSVSKKVCELCNKHNISKAVYILSNDKDMYQCVTDTYPCKINIIRKFGKGDRWLEDADLVDYHSALEKFNNAEPSNLPVYRAICGDTSDNLTGYPRFQKKVASEIANKCTFTVSGSEVSLKVKSNEVLSSKAEKGLSTILENVSILESNYRIMLLKIFDFELKSLDDVVKSRGLEYIVDLIIKYNMRQYRSNIWKYSSYKVDIANIFSLRGY